MTRLILTFLAVAANSLPAHADVSCSGSLSLPGSFLNGHCTGTSCSGYLYGGTVTGTGYCGSGVTVQVQATRQGSFVNGQCMGSSLSIFLSGDSLYLQGRCSDGGTFFGQARSNGGFVNGTCTENGSFNVFMPSEQASFSGYCR